MDRVGTGKEMSLLDTSEEVCLDSRHILGKMFPATIGRVIYGSEANLLKNCKYCTAERRNVSNEY